MIVAGDGLRTRRPGPYGKVSLALVEVLDLLQRASVEDRLEDRLRIDADARLVEGGGCAGDADAIGVRGIGTARRAGIDAVAELLEKALAQLRGADVLVSAEAHLLDPDLPALVHREDDRRRAVATGKLALGDAGTQETLRDVEAPQAGRHLLRRLRIEGLVLAGGSELLHEERIGILPVAADVEAHHRTGIDRDHDAGARLALFLHHGRADAGAEPACLAVAIAQTADAVVERGEIQDVSRNDAEGEGKLFGGEARRAREADAGDAGGDALLDAKVEGDAVGARPGHRRDPRGPVPLPVIRRLDRLGGPAHQRILVLGVDLEVGGLRQHRLGKRRAAGKGKRHELAHRREHEDEPDALGPSRTEARRGQRLEPGGDPGKTRASVQRPHRVADHPAVEYRAFGDVDQRGKALGIGPFENDLTDVHGVVRRGLHDDRPLACGMCGGGGGEKEGGDYQLHSPSHLNLRSAPKSVLVVRCSLSSWSWPLRASDT